MEKDKAIPENKFADVPIRVRTWVFIIIVFGIGISHIIAMQIFVSWIAFQTSKEFLRMILPQKRTVIFALTIGIIQFLLLYQPDYSCYIQFAPIVCAALTVIFAFIYNVISKKLLYLFFGLSISLISFAHLYFVRIFENGIYLILFLVVVTELNDVFQYLMGKFFGKHKIVPKISPNKTVEGFVGGLFLTILLSIFLGYFLLPKMQWFPKVLIGSLLGIFGFFGDVLLSVFKRKFQIKDSGKLLPGHGGLLDRMDSLVFNAPLFFILIQFLY